MALSLADELELDLEMSGEGGGMSLADEFGGGGGECWSCRAAGRRGAGSRQLTLGMLDGADDLAAELDAALGDADEGEGVGGSLADDMADGRAADHLDSDYGDGDGRAHALEPGTPPDAYGPLAQGHMSTRTPGRTPARTPRGASASARHSRVPSARTVAAADNEDPLDLEPLHDAMRASARMCALLRDMDGAGAGPASAGPAGAHACGSPTASGSRATVRTTATATAQAPPLPLPPVEERLAGYISRLTASERTRDDQARDVAALVRDLEGVVVRDEDLRWVDLVLDDGDGAGAAGTGAEADVSDGHSLGMNGDSHGHGHGQDPDNGHDSLETNGYTNSAADVDSPASPSPGRTRPNGAGALLESIAESPTRRPAGSPPSPTSPLSPVSPHASAAASGLAIAVARLGADTSAAASALNSLRDGASVGATSAAGAARTLRGLRLAIYSLRDGQAAEDAAQRAVEAYEARLDSMPRARAAVDAITAGLDARLAELADAHVARCRRPCSVP